MAGPFLFPLKGLIMAGKGTTGTKPGSATRKKSRTMGRRIFIANLKVFDCAGCGLVCIGPSHLEYAHQFPEMPLFGVIWRERMYGTCCKPAITAKVQRGTANPPALPRLTPVQARGRALMIPDVE